MEFGAVSGHGATESSLVGAFARGEMEDGGLVVDCYENLIARAPREVDGAIGSRLGITI